MSKPQKRKLISGYKWQPVTLNEIMTYFGSANWTAYAGCLGIPYHNAWTKFMSKERFFQITSALHFNDNDDEEEKED